MEIFLAVAPNYQISGRQERIFCEGPPTFGQTSAVFGRTEVPNSIFYERQHEAEGWRLHINNELGFRDIFDVGDPTVLVFGDSFTRGSLVNNGEVYTDLLDVWMPDTGIRSFGIGGWGTRDELRAYRAVAPNQPHSLVILAYYLGNDLTDNMEADRSVADEGVGARVVELEAGMPTTSHPWFISFLHQNTRTVRFVGRAYSLLLGRHKNYFDRSEAEIAGLVDLTSSLLNDFGAETIKNGSDFLIVIIPDFNEFVSERALWAANEQRAMIDRFAARDSRFFSLDLRGSFSKNMQGTIFGKHDKHLSRFGQYIVAQAIANWMGVDAPDYVPTAVTHIEPDCERSEQYGRQLGAYGPRETIIVGTATFHLRRK